MQRGFAPILIVLLVVILGLGGYFAHTSWRVQPDLSEIERVAISPSPSVSLVPSSSAETTNWKTYRAPAYIGVKLKYPADKLVGDIVESTNQSSNAPTQDENMVLWQTTIPLKGSNILMIRKHNINLSTNKPYNSLEEYDPRTKNFPKIQVSNNDAKDSKEYLTQGDTYQRDIIFFRKNYIWIIQEISSKNSIERYLEEILATWTFFEYSPSEAGIYKDVDR